MQIKRSRRKSRGRARPTPARVAVVGSLAEARAALTGARGAVVLASPPGAARYLGVGYFWALVEAARAEFPGIAIDAVMDCADDPGRALSALRMGFRSVVLRGHPRARAGVAAIARALGARLLRQAPRST
ncbi:MAG TPA: hypothetical protein VIF14_06610 [Alphaproteobacteria bacterium]|jgi:hypothetical protein